MQALLILFAAKIYWFTLQKVVTSPSSEGRKGNCDWRIRGRRKGRVAKGGAMMFADK